MSLLSRRDAIIVFASFTFAYFFSALLRGITATLSPSLTQEFGLDAADLGLLAGGYFLGFSLVQLPLGAWLDKHGPKRVVMWFLAFAVIGCVLFSMAKDFNSLMLARLLAGIGASACLMAPLTGFRRWLTPATQLRASSWILMAGSLGTLAATLPVQLLTPIFGWRPLFLALAAFFLLSVVIIAAYAPGDWRNDRSAEGVDDPAPSYGPIWRNAYFRRMTPIGFFSYGGLVAVQTLWAGPWMTNVGGLSPLHAAVGLFWLNVGQLVAFFFWGAVTPSFARRKISVDRLIARGMPVAYLILVVLIVGGDRLGGFTGVLLVGFCMASSFVTLALPSVAMAIPRRLAGRALSAYNLVIFGGVFVIQWVIGLVIDGAKRWGLSEVDAYRVAFTVFLACSVAGYIYFLALKRHNAPQQQTS